MRFLLTPERLWPLFVIVLLCSSPILMFSVIVAARSDGGAQVVDAYYEKAVAWDSLETARNRARHMDWAFEMDLDDTMGLLHLSDAAGAPIEDIEGEARISRPQRAHDLLTSRLVPTDSAGTYRFEIPPPRRGLWDITVDMEYSGERFLLDFRKER